MSILEPMDTNWAAAQAPAWERIEALEQANELQHQTLTSAADTIEGLLGRVEALEKEMDFSKATQSALIDRVMGIK